MIMKNLLIWYYLLILIIFNAMIFKLKDKDEYIKLGQLLKACNMVYSGAEAKIHIQEGIVLLNNNICKMRGKKIYRGDKVKYKDKEVEII